MKLEDIGFYTLSDERAKGSSKDSQLMRCELILTEKCNFKCPYCRGLRDDIKKTLTLDEAKFIVDVWAKDNLKNIRLSGGEPTTWPHLFELVEYIKLKGVERIAISTNGSASFKKYQKLVEIGVNDFSISLDACCSQYAEKMAGVKGIYEIVTENIAKLAKLTYVTVGIVVNDDNINQLPETIEFAYSLGVSDIRVISSAQYNQLLDLAQNINQEILESNPILKYRVNNIAEGRNVRGLSDCDTGKCRLVLDDMAIAGHYHFPCIIYMREGGDPIGVVDNPQSIREQRYKWFIKHNSFDDEICRNNCLDVCIDYNNACHKYRAEMPKVV